MNKDHYQKTWKVMNDLECSLIEVDNYMNKVFETKVVKSSSDYEKVKAIKFVFDSFMQETFDKMTEAWDFVVRNHPYFEEKTITETQMLCYDSECDEYFIEFSDAILTKLGWQVGDNLEIIPQEGSILIRKENGK
jgi:hypothetical protein